MKKAILLLLAFVLALNTVNAQNSKNNSLLWEVSGKGLSSPSYLFGTYHFASKKLVDSLAGVKKYFNNCKAVVGEVKIDTAAMMSMIGDMMLPDTVTLDKLYSAEDYKLISDYVAQTAKMNMMALNKLKPAVVQTMLMAYIIPKTFSDTNPPIDIYFQQEGKRLQYPVSGFETMKDQSDLLFGAPLGEQKKNLLKSIHEKDEMKLQGEKLYALYLKQDLDGIEKFINDAMAKEATPELSDKMLKDRNLKWMVKIPAIVAAQPTFMVVGAAHLVGQYGLINQLRLKGYTIKAVKI